ncbi:hypothetical protein ACFQZ4_02210 [Catellatospora coxensis]
MQTGAAACRPVFFPDGVMAQLLALVEKTKPYPSQWRAPPTSAASRWPPSTPASC